LGPIWLFCKYSCQKMWRKNLFLSKANNPYTLPGFGLTTHNMQVEENTCQFWHKTQPFMNKK
jgi:hypothetical protein